MGLNNEDHIPYELSDRERYRRIYKWYKNNLPYEEGEYDRLFQIWQANIDAIQEFENDITWTDEKNNEFINQIGFDHSEMYNLRWQTLVNHFPDPDSIEDIEIDAIMIDIEGGYLENGYHQTDEYGIKMAAYARPTVNRRTKENKKNNVTGLSFGYGFGEEETEELDAISDLRQYLNKYNFFRPI